MYIYIQIVYLYVYIYYIPIMGPIMLCCLIQEGNISIDISTDSKGSLEGPHKIPKQNLPFSQQTINQEVAR